MRKVIVTGGAGFIGHHLVNALVDRGDDVLVIDNFAGDKDKKLFAQRKNDKANLLEIDITDSKKELVMQSVFNKAEYVFHLAALPRVQASIDDPVGTAMANVVGTVAILNAAQKAGVKRVVFASSSSVYGDSERLPLQEDHPADPMSPYARHKFQGEQYCQDFAQKPFNLESVCLRFFNVYGPGADPNGAYALVVAKFLEQRRHGKALTITGDGTQTRDFTHVRDVVAAMLLAAESQSIVPGEVINIGGGRQISVNEIAKAIGGNIEYVSARLEPHDTLASIEKARIVLRWTPQVSFEDGIAELLELNS